MDGLHDFNLADYLKLKNASEYTSSMKDGLLRIRITNKCNGRCRYCGILHWPRKEQELSLDPKFLYDYCIPLYEQIKILLITGGDAFVATESYNYAKFISQNYPHITIITESNGLAFSEKWRELASNNLFIPLFSLNASNDEVFEQSCWAGPGARRAYQKIRDNMVAYQKLLKGKGLKVFGPGISMVINKNNYFDVRDFVKMALSLSARSCGFFFDYTENNMETNYFGCSDTSRIALKELMKLERVLAGKFFIYFRLWIPLKEAELMQNRIEEIPINQLQQEFHEILQLAKGRSMKEEYKMREKIRKERGKKPLTFEEDWTPTIRQININGKDVCFAPFNEIDIYPQGKIECCSWITSRFNHKDFIKNNKFNWDKLFNSYKMKKLRRDMLNGNYDKCQHCCPLNPTYNPICPPHKYGYDRVEKVS